LSCDRAAELAVIFDKTPSYVNSYLRRLTNEGLLAHVKGGKYRFTDRFFKLWVKENAVM
jgi:Mn-dependent DtxR family transcriptional regulator